jgi:hypothetical protein
MPNGLRHRPKLGQTKLLVNILPGNIYRHFASHFTGMTPDNIGEKMRPFLKLDDCNNVGEIGLKRRMVSPMIDNEAVDLSFAAGAYPLRSVRIAQRADNRGWPAHMTALRALLKSQFVISAPLPKGLGVCVEFGQGLYIFHWVTTSSV